MSEIYKCSCAIWLIVSVVTSSAAQDVAQPAFVLDRFLDAQTVFVAVIDDHETGIGLLLESAEVSFPNLASEIRAVAKRWTAAADFLKSQRIDRFYLIVSLADDYRGSLYCVIPNCRDTKVPAMQEWVGFLRSIANDRTHWGNPNTLPRIIDGSLVLGTETTLRRLEAKTVDRSESLPDWKKLSPAANVSVLLRLSSDQKRALTEMVPELPKSLGSASTADMLGGINSVRMELVCQPKWTMQLIVDTTSPQASQQVPLRVARLLGALTASSDKKPELQKLLSALSDLPSQLADTSCTWTLAAGSTATQPTSDSLAPFVASAFIESARGTTFYNLRILMLAVHNHESAYKHFPIVMPAAGSATQLGWRVQLLPFLDEIALYNQFHHDEPYDSPHNQQLISQMPAVFRCPLSKFDVSDGMSNFCLPSSPETLWPADRPLTFADISDGTSNTIAIVEVDDEHAVVWTAPGGFDIHLEKPQVGLGGHFAGDIYCAIGDGSVRYLPAGIRAEVMRALFTRAGGEIIEYPLQGAEPSVGGRLIFSVE